MGAKLILSGFVCKRHSCCRTSPYCHPEQAVQEYHHLGEIRINVCHIEVGKEGEYLISSRQGRGEGCTLFDCGVEVFCQALTFTSHDLGRGCALSALWLINRVSEEGSYANHFERHITIGIRIEISLFLRGII